jgi:hypothetical protein
VAISAILDFVPFVPIMTFAVIVPMIFLTKDVLQTPWLNLVGWTVTQNRPALFRGQHFEDVIIILCVRWYDTP